MLKRSLFSILILIFFVHIFSALSRAEVENSFKYAEDLLYAGRWDEAIVEFKKIAEAEFINVDAIHNLACALACKGDYDKAIHYFEQALSIETDPYNKAFIYFDLGGIYYKQGIDTRDSQIFKNATENFQKAVELIPNTFIAAIDLANFSSAYSKIYETGGKIDKIVFIVDERGMIPDTTVLSEEVDGQKEGERHFIVNEKSLPMLYFYHSTCTYIRIGTEYFKLEDYSMAKEMFNKALDKLGPLQDSQLYKLNKYIALEWLGAVCLKQGNPDKAIEYFLKAKEVGYREYPSLHLSLAFAYLDKRDYVKSKEEANNALLIEPDYQDAKDFLSQFEGVTFE